MNFRARSYDVFAGVFIQPDTVVSQPGNPQSLNRYAFEGGNPLRYTDPSGHAPAPVIPPWWWSGWTNMRIDISGQPEVVKSLAVAGCWLSGSCHVDEARTTISGATQSESLENGLPGPTVLGIGSRALAGPGGQLAKQGIREIGEEASKQLTRNVSQAELGEIIQAAKGAGQRVVVIGETMRQRVIPAAESIGADWYKPRSAIPENWMKNNERWIKQLIKEGAVIIDIGEDVARTARSKYYAMEKRILEEAGYVVTKVTE